MQTNSTAEHDYIKSGFYAARRSANTGLRSDVVTLYQGGEYWLYRYKKYTDVRLVFAPEQQVAFFGGDPDNVTYPRYDLDMALFRVYEDGKPLATKAGSQIFNLQNSLKACQGRYSGLLDKQVMDAKRKDEEGFKARVMANPARKREFGEVWDEIAAAETKARGRVKEQYFHSTNSELASLAAAAWIGGTKLADPEFRKKLIKGGEEAVAASDDPMIVLERRLDPLRREAIKWTQDNVESVEERAGEQLGKARFALPARYLEGRDKLDLSTPFDFVTTNGTIGGNSGSPVINRAGEIVGLIGRRQYRIAGGKFRLQRCDESGGCRDHERDDRGAAQALWGAKAGRRTGVCDIKVELMPPGGAPSSLQTGH